MHVDIDDAQYLIGDACLIDVIYVCLMGFKCLIGDARLIGVTCLIGDACLMGYVSDR